MSPLPSVVGVVIAAVLAVTLAGCPADGTLAEAQASPCEEAAQCMIDECGDELDDLQTCLDAADDPRHCDPPNLAVGRCVDACAPADLAADDRDDAFSVYLCEADSEDDDCTEDWMACGG
jgi:hypothetical protein